MKIYVQYAIKEKAKKQEEIHAITLFALIVYYHG